MPLTRTIADVLDEDVSENFFLKPESVVSFLTRNENGDECLYRVSDHIPSVEEIHGWIADEAGVRMVAIYPKVTGSVSDKDVVANPDKYPGKTAAEESMLTPDLLTWNLGATIGTKFSKKFAIDKTAQKVAYNPAQTAAEPASDDPTQQGGTQQGGTTNPPSGGGENEDGE